jgi:hypothetical protein
MSHAPPQKHGEWTPAQIVELMRLARLNLSARQIASRIGRLEESVQLKAREHHIVLSA